MEFGITFKGFVEPERARKLVAQAEEAGFTYCWFYDSHILWRESFPAMAMCMEKTNCLTHCGATRAHSLGHKECNNTSHLQTV